MTDWSPHLINKLTEAIADQCEKWAIDYLPREASIEVLNALGLHEHRANIPDHRARYFTPEDDLAFPDCPYRRYVTDWESV